MNHSKFVPVLLLLFLTPSAKAADCEVGLYPGLRDTGILIHTSCGNKWRVKFAKTLTYDDDSGYGFTNNKYHFMIGVGYRWIWKRNRFDAGLVYIDEETTLFMRKQYATWFQWSYLVLPKVHCGIAHQSVPFVDDAGRNQVGCDYSFTF